MPINRRAMFTVGAGAAALAATGVPAMADSATGATGPSDADLARSLGSGFRSYFADVNGVRLHYVAGGSGEPLVLLHGWPQTWWEFRKVMPALATRYRVIAVDMRGGGSSDKPQSGYDKKTMARDIYELARKLGYSKINIAGHDIGAMVAFSFAANHPVATNKLAMLDVAHPDEFYYETRLLQRPGDTSMYLWWHAFNQIRVLPEQILAGRFQYMSDWMFDYILLNRAAISPADRAIFARAYNYPDAIRGGNGWYQAFNQDIEDLKGYGQVTVPVLGMAHEAFFGYVQDRLTKECADVRMFKVDNAGHYFVDEQPEAVVRGLTEFFS